MKKTNVILVFALVFFFLSCKKDEGLTEDDKSKFLKSYGILSNGADIKQTSDGGYIMVGTIQGAASVDIYLKKVDEFGNHQWSNTFDGPLGVDDKVSNVEILEDGSYAILGSTEGNKTNSGGIEYTNIRSTYLILVNINGKKILGRSLVLNSLEQLDSTFSTINHETGKNLVITPTGNFLTISEKEVVKSNTPYKVGIIRLVNSVSFLVTDSIQYAFLPTDTIAKVGADYSISDLVINANGDIAFTGFKDNPQDAVPGNQLLFGLYNIILDSSGIGGIQFDFSFGSSVGQGNSILESTSGEILITGFSSDGGNKQVQVYNFGTSASYDVLSPSPIWEFKGSNTSAFEEEAFDMVEVSDGYVLAGFSESNGDRQYYIVKIDKLGNSVIWEKKYGFIRFDEARAIINTSDNGLAVIGTSSDERGNSVMTFLKLDANGILTE